MTHVLIIPPYGYQSKSRLLLGNFQRDQAMALHGAGVKVGILNVDLLTPAEMIKYATNERLGTHEIKDGPLHGVVYRGPNPFPKLQRLKKKHYCKKGRQLFERYCEKFGQPDLVHAHNSYFPGLLAYELHSEFNLPYVITEHNTTYPRGLVPDSLKGDIVNSLENASAVITVSDTLGEAMHDVLPEWSGTYQVIPNVLGTVFCEKPEAGEQRSEVGEEDTWSPVFINVASLDAKKDHETLLKAFSEVVKNLPSAQLRIIGDGPDRANLEALVTSLGIAENISFLGVLPPEHVCEEMRRSDAFVLSSQFETFGVVVIEALACGLPVVATRCGGPEHILDESNGILVDIGRPAELGSAMLKLLENRQDFDSTIIRRQCVATYGTEAIASQLISVYNSVLATPGN